jgi:hypothetical protein
MEYLWKVGKRSGRTRYTQTRTRTYIQTYTNIDSNESQSPRMLCRTVKPGNVSLSVLL